MARLINEKLDTLIFGSYSTGGYWLSAKDKNGNMIIEPTTMNAIDFNKLLKSEDWKNHKFYDKNHSEYVNEKFCNCVDCLNIRGSIN